MVEIDETDRGILDLLKRNSRRPFTEIAEKLDVSEGTVRKRVRCLEEEGVIKGYTLEIDPAELGYDFVTILGVDVDPKYLLDIVDKVREIEEVRWAAKSTGDHMIMTEIWAKETEDLSRIISEKIGKLEGVVDMKPAILLEKRNKEGFIYDK